MVESLGFNFQFPYWLFSLDPLVFLQKKIWLWDQKSFVCLIYALKACCSCVWPFRFELVSLKFENVLLGGWFCRRGARI